MSNPSALREFLLSQALSGQLKDSILQEALMLIKTPAGNLEVAQLAKLQLLEEWRGGRMSGEDFALAWDRLAREGNAAPPPAAASGPLPGWIPYFALLALLVLGGMGWLGYRLWSPDVQKPAVAAAPPAPPAPGKPVSDPPRPAVVEQLPEPPPTPVEQAEKTYREEYGEGSAKSTVRAYVAEGLALADMAKVAVAEYAMSMGVYPESNAQAGIAAPADIRGSAVESVAVGAGGTITVRYNKLVGKGQTLVLEPSSSGGGPIVWDCKKGSVPANYRPPHCR